MSISKKWFGIKEFCRYTGWNVRTVRNRIAPGAEIPFPIKTVRIGRRVFISREDADRYLEELAESQARERAEA